MSGHVRTTLVALALAGSVVGVVGMLGPWARSGRTDRSSVDLLATAGSLDLIEGMVRVLAVATWAGMPILVAGGVLAAAWGRARAMALLTVPVGPVLATGWWLVARTDAFSVRWAAPMSALAGLTASLAALLILMTHSEADEASR